MASARVTFGSTLVWSALAAVALQAQTLAVPAEFPPASYSGTQYIDSTGCAFIRAGSGVLVNWVPRVSRNRDQLCGFVPTQVAPAAQGQAPAGPIVLFDDEPPTPLVSLSQAPAAAPQTPEPMTFAEACEGRFGVQSGFLTAAGQTLDCGPEPASVPAAIPPAPIAVPRSAPAPVAAAPVPSVTLPAPVVIPDVPPRVTLAQACEGRFGVQAGFETSEGVPVDCGPAPVAAPAPAPVIATPVVAPAVPPQPELRRVSLTKICAEIAATGRRVIDAATGQPVACTAPAAVAAPLVMPGMVPAAPRGPATAVLPVLAGGPVPVASVGTNPTVSSSTPQRIAAPAPKVPFVSPEVPASNPAPSAVANEVIRPPAGFRQVWTDGRINPNRGLRRISAQEAMDMGLIPRTGS